MQYRVTSFLHSEYFQYICDLNDKEIIHIVYDDSYYYYDGSLRYSPS